VSNFQWVCRYSGLNVTNKKPYKRFEGKTTDLLIAFIGYVNDLNKLQQFKVSLQKSNHRHNALFNSLGNSRCSSPQVALTFLLYEGSNIHNASDQFVSGVYFFLFFLRFSLYAPTSNICILTPIENWTHFYMNLFALNSPCYHLLKYLLFLLKRPVYVCHCN
jgi:hypothetical protein